MPGYWHLCFQSEMEETLKTFLHEVIEKTEEKERYDASCKLILSQKIILGWILKDYLPEYDGLTVEEISAKYIEGEPQVSRVEVPMIRGIHTEDTNLEEGRISGDIRFRAEVPCGLPRIFNIEAQSSFHKSYPMTSRGSYYLGRLLSAQRGTEFKGSEYGDLKKVYVIWIFLDPPELWKNSVTYYEMTDRQHIGFGTLKPEVYDYMTQILIGLGDPEDPRSVGVLRLLNVLFSSKMKAEEKKRILESEFCIPMTEELEEGVDTMCNFSDAVERRGILKGRIEGRQEGRAEGRIEGRIEGRAEGMSSLNELYHRLIGDGRMEDLIRATGDEVFFQSLLNEYALTM